ncbi:MAG: CRISPR-associated endonuclease Cas3'' [Terracidiphilus sp.]|nr:CRISPR-associated endonuclease Cas3'' [Terracidiphilus sp.]
MTAIYAHTKNDRPEAEWEPIQDHLTRVAARAEQFCAGFAPGFGQALGQLHDIGKYQPKFQAYLHACAAAEGESSAENQKTQHAIVGAAWACGQHAASVEQRTAGMLMAFAIAAHHGRMRDPNDLRASIAREGKRLADALGNGLTLPDASKILPSALPTWAMDTKAVALGIRMLFSALIDADMLESEAWDQGHPRTMPYAPLEVLLEALEKEIANKRVGDAIKQGRAAELAALRASVADDCRAAADLPTGRFRLTVPTGGGKTLSGLRFALHHAIHHHLSRVIVVIPYTSILEQTVEVYRRIFDAVDANAVVEHHSSLDPDKETQQHQWACENWDAPIVVTTSVQFFESLYANHKRPCRKLHRIAESVVLLDEVQTFPLELCDPIQQALDNLTKYFHTSVVSMTATQPLLRQEGEREIVSAPEKLYAPMRDRYTLEWLGDPLTAAEWEAVAARAQREERVLAVVHARKDAELLAKMLGEDCIHLSARMCAAHRLRVIDEIRKKLKGTGSCRVVATQLVEAGVDLDFPVVMRAFAGMESLAQAAGRCNREFGPVPGRFVVFHAPTEPPKGTPRAGLSAAVQFYRDGRLDLHDPDVFPLYTQRVLQDRPRDPGNVLGCESELDFEDAANKFKMIDNAGASVVVPYGEGWDRVQQVRREEPSRNGMRSLQRYTVTVYDRELRKLRGEGLVERLFERAEGEPEDKQETWVVRGDLQPMPYSARFGLTVEAEDRIVLMP